MEDELKCEDCGTTEGVYETLCPYAEEICDESIGILICDDCYHERCMGI